MKETHNHEFYMKKCIELGLTAKAAHDNPVGSLLIKDNQLIAEGIESSRRHKDITYHAEIEAIRNAVRQTGTTDLTGYTMYTTHEPCIMCAYVIRHHRITTVVMGLTSGETGGYSSAYKILLDRTISKWSDPPHIITGILEKECSTLL